jgi:hypothetical protein
MVVSITFLVIKLFTNRIHADSIYQEMMSLENENVELSKNTEEYSDDFEFESYEKQEGFIEGLKMGDIGKEMKKTFEKPLHAVRDKLKGPLDEMVSFFRDIGRAFRSIPIRARAFDKAFKLVGEGIKLEFDNLGKSLKLGFNDVFGLIDSVGKCGIKTIENFRICVIWYIMDLVGATLYSIIVVLPVFITFMITGFNLQPYVDEVNKSISYIDSLFFNFTCYHIFKFPRWVIDACYTCDFKDKINKINIDWGKTIPDLLQAPLDKFIQSEKSFKAVISDLNTIERWDDENR